MDTEATKPTARTPAKKKKRATSAQYVALRKEIHFERLRTKMSIQYYGEMANWRQVWVIVFNAITLLASGGAAISFLAFGSRHLEYLAVIAAAASVVGILNSWPDKKAQFLHAQVRSSEQEIKWDALWLKIDNYSYRNFSEVNKEYTALREEDARIAGLVEPHVQRNRLSLRIQKRVQRSLGLRGEHNRYVGAYKRPAPWPERPPAPHPPLP